MIHHSQSYILGEGKIKTVCELTVDALEGNTSEDEKIVTCDKCLAEIKAMSDYIKGDD